jgi:hypothetical protein
MMANVTTHKMTKLDRLRVLASEWSAQIRPDTNAVSSKKRTAFGVFMARRCRAVVDKAFCRSLLREFVADEAGPSPATLLESGRGYPPGMSSSKGSGRPDGGPLATWRTIEMISCTISPGADIKLNERVRLRRAFEILSLP